MLRLLLFLSVLVLLPHAQLAEMVDLSACPLNYYGTVYDKAYMAVDAFFYLLCFDATQDPINDEVGTTFKECITLVPYNTPLPTTEIKTSTLSAEESEYQAALSSIPGSILCEVTLTSAAFIIKLASFGSGRQTALFMKLPTAGSLIAITIVNGENHDTISLNQDGHYIDISGCRDTEGNFVAPDKTIVAADAITCSSKKCTEDSEVEDFTCDPPRTCHAGVCSHNDICSVFGHAILNFDQEIYTVDDRCTHILVGSNSILWHGLFRERRYTKPSFLNMLMLTDTSNNKKLQIDSYGVVTVDGVEITLTNTAQDTGVGNLMLHREETGIVGTSDFGSYSINVFFDGTTAQLTFIGPDDALNDLGGVCTSQLFLITSRNCEDGADDPMDDPVFVPMDCTTVQPSRCDVLLSAPFSDCNAEVDPAPYIELCQKVLCSYEEIDSFNCRHLYLYERICSKRGITLGDWRFSQGCPPPQYFCSGDVCLDHEYCSVTDSGRYGCFCRGDFSKSYREADTYGGEVECTESVAHLRLYSCFLEQVGIDPSTLRLNDESCSSTIDPVEGIVSLEFGSENTCNAEAKYNEIPGQLVYTNDATGNDALSGGISRTGVATFTFGCAFDQPDAVLNTFDVIISPIEQYNFIIGSYTFTLTMKAFTDSGLTQPVSEPVSLGQMICVSISTSELDPALINLVTDSCYAVNEITDDIGERTHSLIENGCPNDVSVVMDNNGEGLKNSFCFNIFQFEGHTGAVHLNCNIQLCAPVDTETCVPICPPPSSRRRRSTPLNYINEEPAVIAMSWTQ